MKSETLISIVILFYVYFGLKKFVRKKVCLEKKYQPYSYLTVRVLNDKYPLPISLYPLSVQYNKEEVARLSTNLF